jgi:hypothetical protein
MWIRIRIRNTGFCRCALAVRREWRSVEHSVQFWKADHDDDPSLKLELVEEIAELHTRSCMKCLCPKEVHFSVT